MKYGRIIYGRNDAQGKNQYVNLGDDFQAFALDNLYRYMGIDRKNVVSIKRTEISSYNGEKVLLPFNGCFIHTKGAPIFPVSQNIEPRFFGFHCIAAADRKHIKKVPDDTLFCCRDESTYNVIKKLKKNAYISGCLTIALPKRDESIKGDKIFLVDAPNGIEAYMPPELKENTEVLAQSILVDEKQTFDETYDYFEKMAYDRLEKIKNEAKLVITSRLHIASPCVAMGIPVILARKYFDERYSWIDKFLPLYTPDKFGEIDWSPKPMDIEEHKKLVLKTAASIINDTSDKTENIKALHNAYMNRNKTKVGRPFYTKAYYVVYGAFPKTANYLREVVFSKFTIETGREK